MTKFCSQCGAAVNESQRFCNKCGAKLLSTQPAEPQTQYQSPQSGLGGQSYQSTPQSPYQQPYQSPAAGVDLKPNVAAMLCYPLSFISGILFLVLTPHNKDRFVRFHAYQSIFFGVALFALNVMLGVFSLLPLGSLTGLFSLVLRLIAIGGTGWLMYQAYHGNQFKLPVVGDLAESQANKP